MSDTTGINTRAPASYGDAFRGYLLFRWKNLARPVGAESRVRQWEENFYLLLQDHARGLEDEHDSYGPACKA
jgi:hypothetical protein